MGLVHGFGLDVAVSTMPKGGAGIPMGGCQLWAPTETTTSSTPMAAGRITAIFAIMKLKEGKTNEGSPLGTGPVSLTPISASGKTERRDLWHEPWAFATVVVLLSAEWVLRRRWGLR